MENPGRSSVAYFPNNSKYDSLIWMVDTMVTVAHAQGHIDRIMKKYGQFDSCRVENFKETPLPMKPFLGIIFLLIVGCSMGFAVFAMEFLVSNVLV